MNSIFLKIFVVLILVIAASCFFFQNKAEQKTNLHRPPTGAIQMHPNHQEGVGNGAKRKAWMESMHKAAPSDNWRKMDREFMMNRFEQKQEKSSSQNSVNEDSSIGQWKERGSLNQAGNLEIVRYDQKRNNIYGISGGGTLWKSKIDGKNWKPISDDLKFNNQILALSEARGFGISSLRLHPRIFTCIDKQIFYSDNLGKKWNQSTGLSFYDDFGTPINLITKSNSEVYYLVSSWDEDDWDSMVELYYSKDNGRSFTRIKRFYHDGLWYENHNYTSAWSHDQINEIYISHRGRHIYKVEKGESTTVTNQANMGLNIYQDLDGSLEDGKVTLYNLSDYDQLFSSDDLGENWTQINTLPTKSWQTGISVNPNNKNQLAYGEVNAYRSNNGGMNWYKINDWGDYYFNIDNLHADIMDVQFFKTSDNQDFSLIANHGGLHISYNDLHDFKNISRSGLNIGQYWDVRTLPSDSRYIVAGSQDQGLQVCTQGLTQDIEIFNQLISGDYGQIAFSGTNGVWVVYPGPWITYYNNIKTGFFSSDYTIIGDDLSAFGWMSPTAETSDPDDRSIWAAGGNIDGGSGCYLIKLTAGGGPNYNIDADQFDYDFQANSKNGNSTIAAIENSEADWDRIFVSSSDGDFFYSRDGGDSWDRTNSFNGPDEFWLYGSTILASKLDPDKVWFGGSGYSNPGVFESNDGGETFSRMDNGLPNTLVYEITSNDEEDLLFAATEVGPYMYIVEQNQWISMDQGRSPFQEYFSVEYISSTSIVRFGTYGRGVWDFILSDGCAENMELSNNLNKDIQINVSKSIKSSSTITPGVNVSLNAGTDINLKAGFSTNKQSNFEAKIDGCNN